MLTALLPFLWLFNGLLAILYLLMDNVMVLALILPLAWLGVAFPNNLGRRKHSHRERDGEDTDTQPMSAQRLWAIAAGGLAVLAAMISPPPVPFMLLLMAGCGVAAVLLEQLNPIGLHWRIISMIALYALAGLGFSLYDWYASSASMANVVGQSGALLGQGQSYLNLLIGIAMYAIPLGYLVMLAQTVLVHPPLAASPEDLAYTIRSRGKQ